MYLERLELQGFKTFAQKTHLEFLPPAGGKRGITAIVGPNGSGKSNLADSVRWVLGEQSLKLLRGKKSEDVIFSGTERRTRAGFAEVSITLNNEDRSSPIDLTDMVVSRRLYRDGQSEYLTNGKPVRLTDVQLMLAQANFGTRSYAVIGQGMVDHILVASPQERKEFFDEAAGVRQFQIKRNQATNKLGATRENLRQAEALAAEIEPRLRSLSRQVRRLEDRAPLEEEFKTLGQAYYGTLARELREATGTLASRAKEIENRRLKKQHELDELHRELAGMEKAQIGAAGLLDLQKEYESISHARGELREELLKLENSIAITKLQNSKAGTVPIPRIIHDLEGITARERELIERLDRIRRIEDLAALKIELHEIFDNTQTLLAALTGPARGANPDQKLLDTKTTLTEKGVMLDRQLSAVEERIRNFAIREDETKGKFFSIQRNWEARQLELSAISREASDISVEFAKRETQLGSIGEEVAREMRQTLDQILAHEPVPLILSRNEAIERLRRLKTQLELIGGIDPEVIREHGETSERHRFLAAQIEDLKKATSDLKIGIGELDAIIEERAETAFQTLNREFGRCFKQLFDGGQASLSKTETEIEEETGGMEGETGEPKTKKGYTGIEIQASPPGKRVKAINMLSGGERALTSIALICAIMASNPSPFVVLDEVDAALDELNSIRFAEIIEELSNRTQFIVITHNRATMQQANVLYGVTLGDDGTSRLLSLKLEDVEAVRGGETVTV